MIFWVIFCVFVSRSNQADCPLDKDILKRNFVKHFKLKQNFFEFEKAEIVASHDILNDIKFLPKSINSDDLINNLNFVVVGEAGSGKTILRKYMDYCNPNDFKVIIQQSQLEKYIENSLFEKRDFVKKWNFEAFLDFIWLEIKQKFQNMYGRAYVYHQFIEKYGLNEPNDGMFHSIAEGVVKFIDSIGLPDVWGEMSTRLIENIYTFIEYMKNSEGKLVVIIIDSIEKGAKIQDLTKKGVKNLSLSAFIKSSIDSRFLSLKDNKNFKFAYFFDETDWNTIDSELKDGINVQFLKYDFDDLMKYGQRLVEKMRKQQFNSFCKMPPFNEILNQKKHNKILRENIGNGKNIRTPRLLNNFFVELLREIEKDQTSKGYKAKEVHIKKAFSKFEEKYVIIKHVECDESFEKCI